MPVITVFIALILLSHRCDGLILLETFTTLSAEELMPRLPHFLHVVRNVTGDPEYSMYNLSKKEDSHRRSKEYGRQFPSYSSRNNSRAGDSGSAANV